MDDLDPRLSGSDNNPAGRNAGWDAIKTIGFHETEGAVVEVVFADFAGDCTLTVSTADGPVEIELGNACKTYRYAEKVSPGVKLNLRTVASTEAHVVRVLEPGDIVFPTGELVLATIATRDEVEQLLYKEVLTPSAEVGWVLADDEVFEYAGFIEASDI